MSVSLFAASQISSGYVRLRNNKRKKKEKGNKGARAENSGRNGKILFFHSSRGRRWRDEVRAVFSEKIHRPRRAAPARGMSICIFSALGLPPHRHRYILLLWCAWDSQILKRKHRPKVKPNFSAFLQSQNKAGVKLQ